MIIIHDDDDPLLQSANMQASEHDDDNSGSCVNEKEHNIGDGDKYYKDNLMILNKIRII